MYEIFAVAAGIFVALLLGNVDDRRWKGAALVASSIIFGAIASYISGELFVSWAFLAIDTALVLLGAGATIAFQAWWSVSQEASFTPLVSEPLQKGCQDRNMGRSNP
jgi:hypothetical protein